MNSESGLSVVPAKNQYISGNENPQIQVIHKKLDMYYDPETVYMELFADCSCSFWLDSSRVEKGLSRFSFMGTDQGPWGKRILYCEKEKTVQVIGADEEQKYHGSILTILTESLSD